MHKIISISILKVKRQSKDRLFSFEEKKKDRLQSRSARRKRTSQFILYVCIVQEICVIRKVPLTKAHEARTITSTASWDTFRTIKSLLPAGRPLIPYKYFASLSKPALWEENLFINCKNHNIVQLEHFEIS